MGAGFNQSMFREMGNIISTEARAIWNANIGALTFFAPNINIFRDPRWGRGQETPGEDPLLTSTYAINLIQGMQGSDKYTKIVGTCKHFAAYSLESWNGVTRFDIDAVIDERDQEETYMPAFKSCVTISKARSVMCSYNSVNGYPACASPYLLQQKLRDEWGFKGFVVSDCDAVLTIFENHHFTTTAYNASAIALKAGTDLNCGYYYQNLPQAMSSALIKETDLNLALERVYAERFDLGMFNRASNPYEKIPWSEINTKKSQDTSLRAAQESVVLLKNNNRTLPLDRTKIKSIAVIGPNAASSDVMKGNYFGVPPYIVTALAGITDSFGSKNVIYAKGCDINTQDKSGFAAAADAAKKADVIVMVMGITIDIEKEGLDRYNLTLPGMQNELIQAVKSVADGKPIIVVLLNGGPIDVSDIKNDNAIGAIVEAWYGGQSGGTAIGNVLFGDYNPGGVLPVTFYANNYTTQIKMTDMNMRPYPGRTYRYLQVPAVYSFGYGLSYTKFEVRVESKSVRMFRSSRNAVRVSVRNVGDRDGDFVALAFAKHASDDFAHEDGALASFDRVHVKAGEKQVMMLYFNDQSFERYRDGKMVTLADEFTITIRGTQHSNVEQFKALVH
jgi:beta-glucosidase-like glycosyl hydrolase